MGVVYPSLTQLANLNNLLYVRTHFEFLGPPRGSHSGTQPSMPTRESACWLDKESPRKIIRRSAKHFCL